MSDICRGCQSDAVEPFLDLGEMPLAGAFLSGIEKAADEQEYALVISACRDCGLVQIVDPVAPEILFADYSFKTGTIPGLVRHFEDYADWIVGRFKPTRVVEFGCNDGTLVAELCARGAQALGIDMAENIIAMGQEEGRAVVVGEFGPEAVGALADRLGGSADVITGSNVFAHNADPDSILSATTQLLTTDGVLCLEVMYAGALLSELQWDTLYHEHLTFYSLGTLQPLLARHGLEVFHAEEIPMHGGSLRIAAGRVGEHVVDESVAAIELAESAVALNQFDTWDRFAQDSRRRIEVFGTTMRRLAADAEIWAYGAAGKATMWVNACQMDYLTAVVDASPLRAGKLMPGVHTPIVSPEDFRAASPDFVFASAWNYLDAIRANEPAYAGAWVVPLPEMRIS